MTEPRPDQLGKNPTVSDLLDAHEKQRTIWLLEKVLELEARLAALEAPGSVPSFRVLRTPGIRYQEEAVEDHCVPGAEGDVTNNWKTVTRTPGIGPRFEKLPTVPDRKFEP